MHALNDARCGAMGITSNEMAPVDVEKTWFPFLRSNWKDLGRRLHVYGCITAGAFLPMGVAAPSVAWTLISTMCSHRNYINAVQPWLPTHAPSGSWNILPCLAALSRTGLQVQVAHNRVPTNGAGNRREDVYYPAATKKDVRRRRHQMESIKNALGKRGVSSS